MDFALSDEQRLLVETARRFVRSELMPLEAELERTRALPTEIAHAIFEKSRALGLYAVNIPTEFGGGGLSAVDTCLAEEQFGHTTDILIRRAFGNVYEVLLLANDLQRKRWLEPAVRGERVFSVCFTEPEAGSDAAGIKSRAVRDGDGWLLSGQKIFISDGAFSDFFVVSAVTDPEKGAKGISLFVVDKDIPGFTIGRDQPMMGLSGTSHVELFFDNVRLGPEHLLGQEGRGLNHAFETLGRIRLAQIGARAVGKATRILDLMTEYARERRQFGRPIGEQQLVQQMLADSAIEINAARLMVLWAAHEIDQGRDARERISMVKVYAAEMLGRVADRAVQVYGGMGYCKDLPIERFYRDARIFRIFDGTSEIHRTVIARSMLKHGAARFADII
jgi:acyl-CoA dehydrogenase